MCGITGAVWNDPARALPPDVLRRMTDRLRHRGPDDRGEFRREFAARGPHEPVPGVALGFRRLAILDLAGGAQPMANEAGDVCLVFNGEIYNYLALRRRLEGAGRSFRTHSDTESLLRLYEDEGLNCFALLNGMFAAAIWDARQRRLVLVRDRLGKKPLVYAAQPGRLLFASELKSLLEEPSVSRELDPAALDEYLTYQYVPHPNTIYRHVKKLPPGHYAVYHDGQLEVVPYWRPDFSRETPLSPADSAAQIRELLGSAVELRMQSDVPLGAFLSGGVDSSLVVALMQRRAAEKVKTFSIGFPDPRYDESRFARQVAAHLGTEHHEFQVTPDAVAILPRLAEHYDEPFADSSAIPTWHVSARTREHVTVALTGDGGDELFLGYPRYRAVAWAGCVDRLGPLRSLLAARCWQRLPGGARQKSWTRRFKRFSEALAMPPARRYLEWIAIFHEARRAELYQDEFLERLPESDPFEFLNAAWRRAGRRHAVTAAAVADLVTYLPCDLMTKVDIASMAHSLECRQPFLDVRVVEWAAALPRGLHQRGGRGKHVLRQAFGDLLPAAIWNRPKMGFGVPLDRWFRGELQAQTRDTLLDPAALYQRYLRPEVARRYVEEHLSGRFEHGYRLWSLLMFETWLRHWRPTG